MARRTVQLYKYIILKKGQLSTSKREREGIVV